MGPDTGSGRAGGGAGWSPDTAGGPGTDAGSCAPPQGWQTAGHGGEPAGGATPRALGTRSQWAIVTIAAVVLLAVIAVGCFAGGYALGRGSSKQGTPGGTANRFPGAQGNGLAKGPGQQGGGGGNLQQRLQQEGATVIRGEVAALEATSLTIQTPQGNQAVSLVPATRLLAPGMGSGPGTTGGTGSAGLAVGDRVVVMAKAASDGSLEAIVVKVQGAAQAPNPQSVI
ncbi:MAG: hypothetical protein ACYC99_01400 [Candidatus Geothermincolia bacterium]